MNFGAPLGKILDPPLYNKEYLEYKPHNSHFGGWGDEGPGRQFLVPTNRTVRHLLIVIYLVTAIAIALIPTIGK